MRSAELECRGVGGGKPSAPKQIRHERAARSDPLGRLSKCELAGWMSASPLPPVSRAGVGTSRHRGIREFDLLIAFVCEFVQPPRGSSASSPFWAILREPLAPGHRPRSDRSWGEGQQAPLNVIGCFSGWGNLPPPTMCMCPVGTTHGRETYVEVQAGQPPPKCLRFFLPFLCFCLPFLCVGFPDRTMFGRSLPVAVWPAQGVGPPACVCSARAGPAAVAIVQGGTGPWRRCVRPGRGRRFRTAAGGARRELGISHFASGLWRGRPLGLRALTIVLIGAAG